MPALGKKTSASAKTHAARKPAAPKSRKSRPRKTKRRKKVSWVARQKQKFVDLRDHILGYRIHALVSFVLVSAVSLYVALAAGVGTWAAGEINDAARKGLIASGMSVEQIRVEGRNRTNLEDIRKAIGIARGDSILHYDVDAARARLEAITWVEDARVIRFLPRTIHVVLTERRPVAIWQLGGDLQLVDASGFVINAFQDDWATDLPLVVGEGAPAQAATLLEALEDYPVIRDNLASAIRIADRRWNLRLGSGIEIRLPAENIRIALAQIVKYNEEHDLLGQEIRSVDLRLPGRVYLKLTDEEAVRLWSPASRKHYKANPKPGSKV